MKADLIKVISFDLDDTLWPCMPTIKSAENKLYLWMRQHLPQITSQYDVTQLRDKRRELLNQRPDIAHDLTRLRYCSFEQLANEFNLATDWFDEAFQVFYEARQQVTLFEDVVPVLNELCNQYSLVSLTNGNASTVKTGVDHWFEFALNSAEVGQMKSQPAIYLEVLKRKEIAGHQMLHVGDHPVQDIKGARAAGIKAIWLNREKADWQEDEFSPDATIHNLHELKSLLS